MMSLESAVVSIQTALFAFTTDSSNHIVACRRIKSQPIATLSQWEQMKVNLLYITNGIRVFLANLNSAKDTSLLP